LGSTNFKSDLPLPKFKKFDGAAEARAEGKILDVCDSIVLEWLSEIQSLQTQ
jgi:hypothetical protein